MAGYRDDQGGIGERPMRDFLPPPEQAVRCLDIVMVTLALSRASVDLFRREAQCQRMPSERVTKNAIPLRTLGHAAL